MGEQPIFHIVVSTIEFLIKLKNEVDLSSILSAILFFFFFFFFFSFFFLFQSLFCYSFSLSTLMITILIIINHYHPIHFIYILISSKFHSFFLSIQNEPIGILFAV